jgi:hypothetical protein
MESLVRKVVSVCYQGGKTRPTPVEAGVPQGDPLAAILFALMINPLLIKIEQATRNRPGENELSGPLAYADNTTLVFYTTSSLNIAVEIADSFSSAMLQPINCDKCIYARNKIAHINESAVQIELTDNNSERKMVKELQLGHAF